MAKYEVTASDTATTTEPLAAEPVVDFGHDRERAVVVGHPRDRLRTAGE